MREGGGGLLYIYHHMVQANLLGRMYSMMGKKEMCKPDKNVKNVA